MWRLQRLQFAIALSLLPLPLFAEQEVTLKSGASLVGTVTIDGDEIVVQIDDAPLRVPLAEVSTIASVDSSKERQARHLLLTALEAKLTNDAGKEVIGILAEASRLAPDDPHIAYWYASSLADAGFGQAARDVLQRRRDDISKAYPGMTDRLAARIERRVEMEKLPPALVERLDTLNATAAQQPIAADMRQMFAMFRLVDQNERAVERSAFQIQCNGQDEKLESFDDGYYLFAFNQHRNNSEQPCNVEVVRPGLESKTFEFSGASNRVQEAGEFVVRRYDEDAKKPFKVRVVGPDGQPVPGAQVTLQAMSPRGGGSNFTRSSETEADGRAEILAFPMTYSFRVHADGFSFESGNVELKADAAQPGERQIALFRAIAGTIRVAWVSTAFQGGGKTTGETTLHVSGGPPAPAQYGQDATSWIRPVQVKDQLTLQIIDSPFGYMGPFGGSDAWVREFETEAGTSQDDPTETARTNFASLDLNKIEELKEKLTAPDTGRNQPGQRGPMVLPAELGKIYIGKLQQRDMRTGQPVQLAFKAMVEKMSSDAPVEE